MRKRFKDTLSNSLLHKTFLAEIFSFSFELHNFIILNKICIDVIKTYSLQKEYINLWWKGLTCDNDTLSQAPMNAWA